MLLAVPCARDPVEVMTQGHNLRTGFINYLQQKHAAGIVNIQEPGSNQVCAVSYWSLIRRVTDPKPNPNVAVDPI